jgi:DNA-binding GntR family transcriptional regulator
MSGLGGNGDMLRHDSLARGAADWIAGHIISGEIKAGEKLTETGLAGQMGVSRSPVREALQALSREGLIIIEPRRGARVAELDARNVRELYECRLLIEPACTAQAAAALSAATARDLEQTFQRMEQAVAGHEVAEYIEALKHYNATLLAACPNRTLSGYAQNTFRNSLRYWELLIRGSVNYPAESLDRNRHLHDAVRARFVGETEYATVKTLERGRDQILRILDQLAADGKPTRGTGMTLP